MQFILGTAYLVLIGAALIDIITRDESRVRHLPKLMWVVIVILLPLVGSIVWFAVGHDWGTRTEAVPFGDPRRQDAAVARISGSAFEVDDAEIEAELRIAEKEARIRRLEAELEARRRASGSAED